MTAAKKEVAVPDVANLPDLVPTPSVFDEIGSDDVALARLKIGQDMSPPVQSRTAEYGDIYSVMSKDDTDPVIGWEFGDEGPNGTSKNKDSGLVFHVIDMYRGKAVENSEGGLELFDYNDSNVPQEAWVTYNYFICAPTLDDFLPLKWVLWKTGRQVAQQINTILKKNQARGPAYIVAFELTSKKVSNDKGRYCVPQLRQVEPTEDNVKVASAMAELLSGRPDIRAANSVATEEPI